MIDKKFIVDGTDFKKLPLRAAYYARTLGFDHDERLEGIVEFIKDFTEHETSWDLDLGYEDNNCSCRCMCEQVELREMLEDAYEPSPFDIIVVTNFLQISRNKVIIEYLLDEGELKVPVFCIETGKIVTNDPENIKRILLTCAHINENDMDESYNMYQDDEMDESKE